MAQDVQERSRLWAKVVAKAWADEAFKNKLKADPVAVLRAEGFQVPDGQSFTVLEDSQNMAHLVLPVMPADAANLDEAEFKERLAASTNYCCPGY